MIVLFLGGAQLLGIGLLGEYLGRLYTSVQGRPSYFVAYDSAESAPEPARLTVAAPRQSPVEL